MDDPKHAMNALRRRQDDTRRKSDAKKTRELILSQAASELIQARDDNGGRLPHKKMGQVIQSLLDNGVKVTRDVMNNAIRREEAMGPRQVPLEVNVLLDNSTISTLPGVDGAENIPPATIPPAPGTNKGRPLGSSKVNIAKSNSNKKACLVAIAQDYQTICDETKKYAPTGYLTKLIAETKVKFGLPAGFYISKNTIRSRVKRKNAEPSITMSPIHAAEESLIQLCLMMGKVRQPLTPTEGIQLMNSLIKDRELQSELIEYKRRRCHLGQGNYPERLGEVGRGYWYGFIRRHSHRLVTKRGERFALSRSDWSKFSYIKQMYDVIYDEFVDAGVAVPREEKVFMDRDGNICDEAMKFGEACDIDITHPEYILFADETGCNTSQKKDGHEGGRKYVVGLGQVPKMSCVTTDHRFTLLPITSASGLPVMCIVIFQGKNENVPASWQSGINISIRPVRDDAGNIKQDESNFGAGKYFPGGPTCTYLGKEIPCATYITESGGINSDILVDVLRTLDELDVFPRYPGGPVPVLIIDGHESRLDPKFLTYINDQGHVWKVCLGVPYATSYWQVGDSSEQNGTFKILWYREKRKVVSYKRDRAMAMALNPEDVIPLLNNVWEESYGRVRTNLTATSDRGWNPPNRKLQSHPELLPESQTNQTNTTNSDPSSLDPSAMNFEDGFSTVVMDRICQHVMRNGGVERRQQRLQEGNDVTTALKEAKKITAGVIVGQGIHSLNNPSVLQAINARAQVSREKLHNSIRKTRNEMRKRIEKVRMIRESKGRGEESRFLSWTADDCKDYLQFKKEKEDKGMPTRVAPLRESCCRIMGRISPTVSPHASDDEADDEAADVGVGTLLDQLQTREMEEQQEQQEGILFSDMT
jgi:hypothetical protein